MTTRRISLDERAGVVTAVPGRLAAVAVPVVRHPAYGVCVVVTRRAGVNGHTGERMSHAGDVVLFGGAVEPGEAPRYAALRELCEEAGTPHLRDDLVVAAALGTWTTESGYAVEGYAVDVPAEFVGSTSADAREVAEIGYLRVTDLRAAPRTTEFHQVDPRDHRLGGDDPTEFESPTIRVANAATGETWTLWGLAGFMVTRWLAGPD